MLGSKRLSIFTNLELIAYAPLFDGGQEETTVSTPFSILEVLKAAQYDPTGLADSLKLESIRSISLKVRGNSSSFSTLFLMSWKMPRASFFCALRIA